MYTLVIGVRHRRAPIEIREKLAFSKDEMQDALQEMLTYPDILEGAILSTCNRSEVYATVTDTESGIRSLKTFLKEYKGFDYNEYMQYAFILLHEDAVMHLFRVASGLDSLALGEGQILAQVKEALKSAMFARTSGEMIDRLFKTALTVGKAVRSETDIASRDISIAKAAFFHVWQNHPDFLKGTIALIGAGKMSEILISLIREHMPDGDDNRLVLINRTQERTENLAKSYNISVLPWSQREQGFLQSDTIFVATGSPGYLIKADAFAQCDEPKVIMDIAVPRNVDPDVALTHPHISLYNTDTLSSMTEFTEEKRVRLLQQAHQIIEREYRKYHQWMLGRSAVPVIMQMREKMEDIRRSEIDNIGAVCPETQKSCSFIDKLSRTLVNKILHVPTVQLRANPHMQEIYKQAEILSCLFNIPMVETPCTAQEQGECPSQQPQEPAPQPSKVLSITARRK